MAQARPGYREYVPQAPLSVEFWDGYNADIKLAFLGMPSESDWILYPPDMFDRSLIRNPFLHQLSRDIGRYSPRTRFAECFLNTKGGPITFSAPVGGDYFGFYTIIEKIKGSKDRVPIQELRPQHTNETTVTGGYLFKIDNPDADERTFRNRYVRTDVIFVEPPGLEITSVARPAQYSYITNYFQRFGAALWGADFTNVNTGYTTYIDVDSWIDHHLLEIFCQNHDGFRSYFFKDRNKKMEMGPLWDLHLSMRDDPPAPMVKFQSGLRLGVRGKLVGPLVQRPGFLAKVD